MAELWDLYDRERRLTGRQMERGQPVPRGCFYLGAEAYTLSGHRILITRRHPDKPFGGMWEFTGGACQAGEDSFAGIRRELAEEIGVPPRPEELIFLGTIRYTTSFGDSYLFRRALSLSDLRLQPEEVVDARFVTLPELERLCRDGTIVPSVAARWYKYGRAVRELLTEERV